MSWEGYKPINVDRICSLVTAYGRERLPTGVSPDVRNCRYTLNSVTTRFGITTTIRTLRNSRVNSIGCLVRNGSASPYIPLMFSDDGGLDYESPVGSGTPTSIAATFPTNALPVNSYMSMTSTFQRAFMTFSDLSSPTGDPLTFNGSQLDPWSMRPLGETWVASTRYEVGEIIAPATQNGYIYRCTVAGTSGAAEPAWPTTDRGTVTDGGATWQEANFFAGWVATAPSAPTLTRVPAGGTYAAGRDVYVRLTFVNSVGESIYSNATVLTNTALNDGVTVTAPTVPTWLQTQTGMDATYAITNYKIYVADVATGAAAPAPASFHFVAQPATTAGATFTTTGAGVAPPTTNTCYIAPQTTAASGGGTTAATVDAGTRYMTVLFVNRNNYISGATNAAVKGFTLSGTSAKVYFSNLPIGPANTAKRIIALTPAGGSDGGPYLYISDTSMLATGQVNSFVINDNTTTAAYLNFADAQLSNSTDVTDNFRKVRLPRQVHCAYLPSLRRIATFGESGQPSLMRLSEADDPETFFGDTGYCYVARDNGEALVTTVDFKGEVFVFKERSTYTVQYSDQTPISWPILPKFLKLGACGPRAVDVGADFLVFANREGLWLWNGSELTEVTEEIRDTWHDLNWAQQRKICVHIDPQEREIRVAAPMGDSTENNVVLTLNYARGLGQPILFSRIVGREIANMEGRKWSVDDIPATHIIRAERPIADVTTEVGDSILTQTQVLLALNSADGQVAFIQTGSFSDNGNGIDAHYEMNTGGMNDSVIQFGGFNVAAKGMGEMKVSYSPYQGDRVELKPIALAPDDNKFYRRQGRGQSRQFGLVFSNGGVPESWFEIFGATVYVRSLWTSHF